MSFAWSAVCILHLAGHQDALVLLLWCALAQDGQYLRESNRLLWVATIQAASWDHTTQLPTGVSVCSYAGYKEVPEAIAGLTQLTNLKLENQCFETPSTQSSASSHANRLLPLRKLKTLSIGSWYAHLPLLYIAALLWDLHCLASRSHLCLNVTLMLLLPVLHEYLEALHAGHCRAEQRLLLLQGQ